MMKKNEQLTRELSKIWRYQKTRKRNCIIEGCENVAINSHILQKNGILSLISRNSHFYMIEVVPFFSIESPDDLPIKFRKIGINKGLSFPLFCHSHDIDLFRAIEQRDYDPFCYQSQLLFAFRSVCKELRKKQIQADIQGGMLNSELIRTHGNEKFLEIVQEMLNGYLLGIKDLTFFTHEIQLELLRIKDNQESDSKFTFITKEVSRLDVCTSTTFSPVQYESIDPRQEDPLNAIIVSIFPKGDKTFVICGYHNNHKSEWMNNYVQSWSDLNDTQIQKRISNILIKRCETWGISPELFDKLGDEKARLILEDITCDIMSHDQSMETSINIFDN